MRLRKDDKEWLTEEISREVAAQIKQTIAVFQPHGWRRATRILRELGPIIGIGSFVVALLALAGAGWYYAFSKIDKEARFEEKANARLDSIDKAIVAIQLKQIALGQIDRGSIQDAKQILESTRRTGIKIPVNAIEQSGRAFINASVKEPAAWDAVLDFISYRTIYNQELLAVGTAQQIAKTPLNPTLATQYAAAALSGYPEPVVSVGGDVPADRAADLHPLAISSMNEGLSRGKEVILIEGGGISLDGLLMKNVVIRNATVGYSGTPIKLENVIFVNCTFVLPNQDKDRLFADAVLSSSSTTLAL